MQQYELMLVPLLSGGGMRIKIIEGMALGKAILSTTLGAEGIAVRDGHDMCCAIRPPTWLEALRAWGRGEVPRIRHRAPPRPVPPRLYDNRRVSCSLSKRFTSGCWHRCPPHDAGRCWNRAVLAAACCWWRTPTCCFRLLLARLARGRRQYRARVPARRPDLPAVEILLAAHNEEAVIAEKSAPRSPLPTRSTACGCWWAPIIPRTRPMPCWRSRPLQHPPAAFSRPTRQRTGKPAVIERLAAACHRPGAGADRRQRVFRPRYALQLSSTSTTPPLGWWAATSSTPTTAPKVFRARKRPTWSAKT